MALRLTITVEDIDAGTRQQATYHHVERYETQNDPVFHDPDAPDPLVKGIVASLHLYATANEAGDILLVKEDN